MKKLATFILVVCFLVGIASCACAEFRGIWVDAFHPGFKSAKETSAMIAKAKECGFNAIFVQVRRRGDVYYRSSFEPMASDVEQGYDPLADVIGKAHAVGLQVHAWVTVYEVFHESKFTKADPGQVHVRHPEWLMKDEQGKAKFPGDRVYLDPGLAEVREYLAGIVQEIVENYKVDGIHLDVVRYPNQFGGYNESSVAAFARVASLKDKVSPRAGDASWSDWRRSQVTAFVALARERIQQTRKGVKLSAAVFGNRTDSYYNRFQDWVGWLQKGLLDFAVPMVFPKDNRTYVDVMADVISATKGKTVYIGQGAWRLSAAASVKQLQLARDAGADGLVVYNYHYANRAAGKDSPSLMDTLKADFFAK